MEQVEHFTATFPAENKHGQYRYREFQNIFAKKHLRSSETRKVFEQIDQNKGASFIQITWSQTSSGPSSTRTLSTRSSNVTKTPTTS
jgi:RNase P protein component